ncbi:uncharacterized protein PHALS_13264 [Plasmopara halstedii]|uniref:Uncharacterized protein n=1 Tax=Plasmopara halstedii TaxID=4781 RepID=A0A0P1ANM9_PLAHL|nr:uncharacterized protein PHALS_13264 [Plasmopara halstedii]CEG43039.1 hypothetical protein PHALS_13264 [Plasmopara halstedii]|eukprot:XP_024579408.1 hypothetical protein PHALS_13264 [Plasmopara halstedii]
MELHEILYSAMTDIFSHQDLNNIFVKALEDPHTVQLANALLECRWSYDRKETHKMLAKVNPYNFFSNHFKEFVGYIRSQNRDQDELVYTFLELKVLTEFYGEDLLAQILVLPKNQIVRGWTYLNALTTVWLGEKKSPVEVMKTVDDDVYNFLYYGADKFSPKLCFSYNSKFYKVYPSEVTMTSLDTLTSAVGPARVAIMLDIAQKSPNSFGKSQGLVYQNTQYQEWYAKKLSPDDVYEMIENDLMKNPWGLSDASDLAESVRIRYTSALLHPDFTKNKELVV